MNDIINTIIQFIGFIMKPYLKIINLIEDNKNNTDQILKYLSKIPDSHLEYGMDYQTLKEENEKLKKEYKKEILLTIPEMCCLQGKTRVLLYYKEKNYDLTQLKERNGSLEFNKNNRKETVYLRPGKHSILSCLITSNFEQAFILKENYNIDLFSNKEAVHNAQTTATLFFDKNLFFSLCLENKFFNYMDFLNNNIEMLTNNISYIFGTKGVYSRKVFDISFIFHEILNITSFFKKNDENKLTNVLDTFFKIDQYNNFIFTKKLKEKYPEIFNDEQTNQLIFNIISNFKELKENDFKIFTQGCQLINWDSNIQKTNYLSLLTKIMDYLIKNDDLSNFDWFLNKTKLFKNTHLIEFLSNKENTENFVYLCLANNHLDRNKNIEINQSVFKDFNDIYKYNAIKENNLIKNEINQLDENIHIKKRL